MRRAVIKRLGRRAGYPGAAFFLLALAVFARPVLAVSYDDVQARGQLTVAVYRDLYPFSYRENGELIGADVDIAREIAARLKVKANVIEQTADENVEDDLRNAVWKGHYLGGQVADVMLHIPYDRQFALRNEQVFFFGAYFQERIGMVWSPAAVGELPNLAVFRYEKIGVELDTLADFYLVSALGGAIRDKVVHFPDVRELMRALKAGEVAGAAGPLSQMQAGTADRREVYRFGAVPMPGLLKSRWLIGAAVATNFRQLGYAIGDILGAMVKDGSMQEIFMAHGVEYSPPPIELTGATAQ